MDASGNFYIADASRILRVDHATGVLAAVAGVPAAGYAPLGPFAQGRLGAGPAVVNVGDGPALSVTIAPTDLVVNAAGNVLFLDGSLLRQLNVQQEVITTIAGKAETGGSTGDGGPATAASLDAPRQF